MDENPHSSIGSPAPGFSLPANNGTQVSLADYLTRKNVYLFFVREFN